MNHTKNTMSSHNEYYIGIELSEYHFTTEVFHERSEAMKAFEFLRSSYPHIAFYMAKVNHHYISGSNVLPFTSMTIKPYGKGYILTPPENHTDWGTKYYHKGWWMPSLDGWFFKKEHYKSLIDGGAICDYAQA